MAKYLSDEEVFGAPTNPSKYLSDDEVFGTSESKPKRDRRESQATAMDYVRAVDSGLGQGIAGMVGGIGTFIQDPAANSLAGVVGAAHLADRGITWLMNKAGVDADVNPALQEQAQLASRFAAESRDAQANDPTNLPARAGRYLQEDSERAIREIKANDEARNPELIAQQRNMGQAEGFVDNLLAAKDNPLALVNTLSRSAPDMAAGIGVGRTLARAGAGLGTVSTAGVLTEAGSSAMQARQGVYQQVAEMSLQTLANSPRFQEIMRETGDANKARIALANELADQVPLLSGAGTVLGTVLTNRLFGGDATAKTIMGNERMTVKELGKRIAQDTLEEGAQGVPEDTVQYGATVQADPNQKYDPAGSLAQNMVAGFAMGSGGHGLGYARDNLGAIREGIRGGQDQTTGAAGQTETPAGEAAPAMGGAAAAAAGSATARGSASNVEAVGVGDTTEAERALRQPVNLTALDRAGEIDGELQRIAERQQDLTPENGYGPAFDQERAELAAQAQALRTEQESIAKTWPKAHRGAPTSFATEAGARIDGQYALMDAADLVTSHDENLRSNPLYPQELQPRDRSRQASELQVSGIVQKLDPARLGLSADAATGAPIVGADGLVESGNARTIALKRVYQANGQKAEDYKNFLRSNAQQFGIDPAQVDAMAKPVLVRVRSTPVNRAEFARQANASTVQRMSPSEQALSDSKRLTTLEGLNPDDNGDFDTSYDFIRQFMAMLPVTEQSDMLESDGKLSTYGYRRIQNAVLAKAYGDSPTLRRMTESMDDNLRNITKALTRVAPMIASARDRMQAGVMYDADLAPDLVQAVEGLSSLKDKGWTVADELGQQDLTGPKYSPEAAQLLTFLSDNIRSPRRIAEFMQRYYEALEQAGDPSQGSMFGDEGPAPTRSDLLNTARGNQNDATGDTQRGIDRPNPAPDAQDGRQSEDAQSRGRSNQGDGTARAAASGGQQGQPDGQSEWVAFPPESGTLGIPRKEMPQVKGEHRGALINFLNARGIAHEQDTVPASSLKPTQAEFSRDKVAKFTETGVVGDRSVLVSSDGYVLDGHHQWMGHNVLNEDIPVIRLDAPIRELLGAVNEFPSVRRSEDGMQDARAAAVADFKAALADLAEIASKHTRASMLPEDTPNLMPTLVKLFDSAIRLLGTDLKRATKWVKDQLKAGADTRAIWNKIDNGLYQKAALQALEKMDKPAQAGLFDDVEAATDALQGDLFAAAPVRQAEKPKVAMINGRPYNYDPQNGDNFKPPQPPEFLTPEQLKQANDFIAKYYKGKVEFEMSAADRATGEALLAPYLKRAGDVKAEYDQKIIDIAKRTGAAGQMLAPLKGAKRAVEKMKQDQIEKGAASMDPLDVKDLLRSTVVVKSYGDAQAVVDEIEKEFKVLRIKNRTETDLRGVRTDGRGKTGGYSDVLINVQMPNGSVAEIQINVSEMLAIKEHQGHKLYEAARDLAPENRLKSEIYGAMTGIYDAAFLAAKSRHPAAQLRNTASDMGAQPENGNRARGSNESPDSANRNTLPSGNSTNSSPLNEAQNRQPSGKLSGSLIGTPLDSNVPQITANGYTGGNLFGDDDANNRTGEGRAQGQEPGAAQGTERQGRTQQVRRGPGRPDQRAGSDADAGAADQAGVGQARADAVRGQDADGQQPQPRSRVGRDAGVPAGRDIPPKSGRNYQFGPDDLTYEGSWFKKAEQNVEAVELLKTLEKEGRQATRDEQKILAKFIGWGASEIANNLFGKKLDKAAEALKAYNSVVDEFARLNRDYLNKGGQYRGHYADPGYYQAVSLLRDAGKIGPHEYPQRVTRAEVEAVKPANDARRWLDLRDRLRAALTPKELAEASRSTQYAHYTSKSVVQSMWRALERMGFKGGAVLEPGAGIGVFPGLMPSAMAANSIYTGIEFDTTTGGVLKQLFPDERILVESFMDTKLPKNFYDVAVGNPPFQAQGAGILSDPEYAKHAFALHDYFFAKSIDRVKPGGLVVYVTSRYTMDKLNDKARKYLSDRADLVGAIRLPQTAFKQNAGTDVVTDVIFLRKKVPGETFDQAQPWSKSIPMKVGSKEFPVNEYFHAHPEMVLGTPSDTGSMQNTPEPQYTVLAPEGDIEALFAKAADSLPADIYHAERGSSAEAAKVREIDFNPKAKKEGNYYVTDAGVLMQREGGVGQRVELKNPKDVELLKDFVPLRDALKQAHFDQLNEGDWESSLKALQDAYAKFTKKHGQINQYTAKTVTVKVDELDEDGNPTGNKVEDDEVRRSFPLLDKLVDDPDWTLVAALETLNEDTGEIKPSAFLSERVLGKPEDRQVATPVDALLTTLNDLGRVDIPTIANRVGLSEAETIEALGSAIYEDPESGWVMADEYLSGNVKRKLEVARVAAENDRRYERNVQALEANQPEPLSPSQIDPRLGMNWIPSDVYEQFMREVLGLKMGIEWHPRTKSWVLDYESHNTHHVVDRWGKVEGTFKSLEAAEKSAAKKNERYGDNPRYFVKAIETATVSASMDEWGTIDVPAEKIMEHALTGRPVRVETKDSDGTARFNPSATEAAKAKLDQIHDRFASWIFSEPTRADRLVRLYNDKFNTNVARKFDGRHLNLPGTSKLFKIFDHVKRGAWRIIQSGNTYLAHAVGSGKTFMMVISAMEQKRLGLVKKPMVVVPNHMLKQFASEWQQLYPAARLMVADEHNFHADNRRRFVSRVALSDLDGVIITHSAFKLLDLDPAFKQKMIEEQLTFFRAALEEAGGDPNGEKGKSRDPKVKRIEKQIENMEQKLKAAMSSEGKDKNVRFDELGVDFLYVDEAHEYRKLDFTTNRQVKGISPQGSARAFDLFMKARYLEEKNPGRSLVLASGTPVTNTIAELYTVQKMLGYQALVDKGIEDFDSWASMFGREKTTLEPNAAGKYEMVTRFQDFANVPELTQMFREFADVLTSDQLAEMLGDRRPKVKGGARKMVITPEVAEYEEVRAELEARMQASKLWKPSPDQPNNPDPVINIITDGRLAAIDPRFLNPSFPSNPDSKLNRMADDVIAKLKETADTQYRGKNKKDENGKEIKDSGDIEPNKGSAIMVFSDLGFGAGVAANRGFNARAWFEKRLRDAGINMNQVAFMSDYKKSSAKLKLFSDVNAGRVRLLVGSSKNMGTGVNAQQRLKAEFHLDSPWYPADLEQREGRIIRQGNKNGEVEIYAYAAKGTYDQQMWGQLANKQMFIDKALSGDPNVRKIEDAGAADLMAMAAGMVAKDPRVLVLAGLNADIAKLQRLYQAHEDARSTYRGRYGEAKLTVEWNEKRLPEAEKMTALVQDLSGDKFKAKASGKTYTDRTQWAEALIESYKNLTASGEAKPVQVGEISGFPIAFGGETVAGQYRTKLMLGTPNPMELVTDPGTSPMGVAMRAQNAVVEVSRLPAKMRERITEARAQMDALQAKLETPFPMAGMLADKIKERDALQMEMAAEGKEKPREAVEDSPEVAPEPGQPFLVYRVSSEDGLANANAGNATGVAAFLAAGDDAFNPTVKAKGSKLNLFRVTIDKPFGDFKTVNGGRGAGDAVGRLVKFGGVQYSFPADGFKAELVSSVPMDDVRAALKARGYDNFDDSGYKIGAEVIRSMFADTTRLARGAGTGGMDVKQLAAVARRIQAGMPNLPKVHVLTDPSKAPKALREYINRQDAWNDVEGAMHNGELYLFASGLSDALRAEHVLAEHEAAHFGLRAILGRSLPTAMNLIYANNASVRKAAGELQKRGKLSNAEAVEEVIVDMPTAELAKLKGWRQVVQKVAEWLGAHGFERMAQKLTDWLDGTLSDQQRADLFVAELVRGAREYVAGKHAGRKPGKGTGIRLESRLSQKLSDDIAKQEQWLQAEARARGFKDIEDLLEKDYPLFEKLATLWREKNPADTLLSRAPAVGSEAFKRWFGDSKVVDAEGRPLVVYHGTSADITAFAPERSADGVFHFAADTAMANRFAVSRASDGQRGANVMPVYLAIKNPKRVKFINTMEIQAAMDDGYDGLIAEGRGHFVAFGPTQIKSAIGNNGQFDPKNPDIRMSRAPAQKTTAQRADEILSQEVGKLRPLDAAARAITRVTGIDRLTGAIYNRAAYLLDRYTPETVKAGIVADYGVPEAVIDQRVLLQGRQRVQLRKAGELIEKLSTLTRAESRVAYEWMNMDGTDPKAYISMMQGLPEESVKVLTDVQKMIDQLSKEAVRLGQLSPEAYERNKFAYLRRSYAKHIMEQTAGEKAKRARVISILGDQYRGRGLTESAAMDKIKSVAPDWWGRKLAKGKADTALKGEQFIRLEYRTHKQSGVAVRLLKNGKTKPYYITRSVPLDTKTGQVPGLEVPAHETTLREVVYWPAGEKIPAQYAEWDQAGTWEVRDVKGPNAIFWRDFTKDEREAMGEVDEARFAIAKTLHGMVHDVEVGRYLEWMAVNQAKKEGETIPGMVVEASERYKDTFKPGEWVRVPDTKISGTNVHKYGKLAGRYLPGPVWNDLRQVVNGQFKPFGDTYAKILSLWKTSKTALSPAVHMNNIMSNFVMADWHDVGAMHINKALRILLAASQRDGKGLIGRAGNVAAKAGIADREAAREILNRYTDSGGDVGSWVTQEIARDQLEPLLDSLEKELQATAGASQQAQTGVFSALQHALMLRFPSAWEAFKPTKAGQVVSTEASNLLNLYQSEDDVFRLAAWLKAKEEGASDIDAGKRSRKSFLDYNINAPWIQAMRQSGWPFISFTYRAVPMLAEIAGKKPHKLMKLMMIAGGLNALGVMLAGGGDDERKLLPEEKAGKIWGMVPKLVRMPWNDQHGSPVYLDIRRFVPVGDVFDVGQGQSAIPVLPGMMPGGPIVILGEILANKSMFTGKDITLDTDTATQKAGKVADHLYKAFAPNILGLPGTYATEGVVGSMTGRTDAFGREMSTAQAVASSFGIKLGSYPADVLRRNLNAKAQGEMMEIQKNISQLKRQLQTGRLDQQEYADKLQVELGKKQDVMRKLQEKVQ